MLWVKTYYLRHCNSRMMMMSDYRLLSNTSSQPIPIKDMHRVNYLLSSSLQQSDDGNVWLSTSVKCFLLGLSPSRSYMHWVNYLLSSSLQQLDDCYVWLSTSVKYFLSGLSLSRSYKHWVNYILSSSLQQFDDGNVWLSTSVKYFLSSYPHQGYALSKLLTIFVAATIRWW